MKKPNPLDWTPYWKSPSITSFGAMFPNNYDGLILEFWKRQLNGEFNHIVDIGCGNGALTWICNEILNQGSRKTHITGVDFADISPFKALGRKESDYPMIRFLGNTPAENLPFENHSIDLVVSQFGVEYTNLDKAIPEIARILTPDGRMSFILHDKESTLIRGATSRLENSRTVLNDIAIHDYALQLDDLYLRIQDPEARQSSVEHRELVTRINMLTNQVRDLVRDYSPGSSIHLYMNRLNLALENARNNKNAERKELIIFARESLRSNIERIEDLEMAALSVADRQRLVSLIQRTGFTVTEQDMLLLGNQDAIGTILIAQRQSVT
jgi:ubiquinone/menaquinone biosynthesis C-methylase UbiE